MESGSYEIWDLTVENLQAAFPAKTLQTSEPINIVNDVAFGPAGVSNTTLAIYLVYDSMAEAGDIFYNGSPLLLTIEAEQTGAASWQLYQEIFLLLSFRPSVGFVITMPVLRLQQVPHHRCCNMKIQHKQIINRLTTTR
jgi:hypothetical protein|tara:strand:+ start:430 stop:846 length:417 start_codon:yes stop_codon:yes gene_type:complete